VPEQCRKHGVNSLIDVLSTNQLMTMLMMLTASANRRRQTSTEHRRYHSIETTTTTTILRPFSGTIWLSRCQKRSSRLCGTTGDYTDHPVGPHFIRTNQCSFPPFPPFFTGRMPFLPPNQQCQSTEGKNHSTERDDDNDPCQTLPSE